METKDHKLPDSFRPLMWSYDFSKLDLDKDQKVIITNTINYGDLDQWQWIKDYYGENMIKQTLMRVAATELRDRVRPLAQLIFSIPSFNYAPRSSDR